jgi:hypothetical protein
METKTRRPESETATGQERPTKVRLRWHAPQFMTTTIAVDTETGGAGATDGTAAIHS